MTNYFNMSRKLNRCPYTNLDKADKRVHVAVLREWLESKPYLSPKVRKAIMLLVPELREDTALDKEFPPDDEPPGDD